MHVAALLLFWITLEACGGSAPSAAETSTSSSTGSETVAAVNNEDDTSAMLADMVAPHLCERMTGSFVGLPTEGGHTGAEAGLDSTGGRWWIRQCTARAHDGVLDLSIAGPGWTWVDRESMGFRIRQYLRFDSSAAFTSHMEVAYDRTQRIATVWLRPIADSVVASVEPRGLVNVEATNAMSGMLGGMLDLTGNSPTATARRTVAEEGSQTLRDRFAAGMTVTVNLAQEQMDFMVGALPRGVVPQRPFPDEAGVVWSINQRASIWPGGLDVLGPLLPTIAPTQDGAPANTTHTEFAMTLEEGSPLSVDAICAADFERYYDLVLQGANPALPHGTRLTTLRDFNALQTLETPRSVTCPYLLIVTLDGTAPGASLRSSYRVRAATRLGATITPTELQATNTDALSEAQTGHVARAYRMTLGELNLSTNDSNGASWDTFGGEPDPYVIVSSIPGSRVLVTTSAAVDVHEVNLNRALEGAVYRDDFPIRITVMDEDTMTDDTIGTADVSWPTRDMNPVVEIRSVGATPTRVGTLRLRFTAM